VLLIRRYLLTWHFRTKGKTLEQMDIIFGDQLVPHALQDPAAAKAAMSKIEEIPLAVSVHVESKE
jgi:hypothetical protein